MIWMHSMDNFDEVVVELNKVHQKIHFTANASSQSYHFLDLTIYKSPEFLCTGKLSTNQLTQSAYP